MRAGMIVGQGTFELIEVPEPEPGEGQALVQVERCGVCGTDVAAYRSGRPVTPFLCGHEWVGTVLGGRGIDLTEGTRVVLGSPPPCGTCGSCRSGRAQFCEGVLRLAGPVPPHGGYAPRINVEARRLHPVPPSMPVDVAALIEPATVALHGVRRTDIRPGDVVLVSGAGAIGLIAVQLAALAGADVVVVEPDDHRRSLALAVGARVHDGEERVDVVLECSGATPAIEAGVRALRTGGQLTLVGVSSTPFTVDPDLWLIREVTVRTSLAHNAWDFDATIAMATDGRLRLAELADRTVSLDELPAAFADLAAGTAGAVKVLVDPHRP